MRRLPFFALLMLPGPVLAQPERYELGRRAHAFEVAWDEKADDPAAKKRAVPLVDKAVKHFLGLNPSEAARELDAARHALESADPAPPAVRWADALQVLPETHVVDAAAADLVLIVKPFYRADADAPKEPVLRARLGTGKPVVVRLGSLPTTIKVPVRGVPGPPSADFKLTAEIIAGGRVLSTRAIGVSRVEKLKERLAAVQRAAAALPDPPKTIEQATFALLVKDLTHLANKDAPETDVPISRFMAGAERLAMVAEPYYIPKRGGEFWLGIPTGKTSTVVRIRIPQKLEERKGPVPVVVCLHGLGGSENAYFDGYGNGIVPRLASERGWIVIGPRVDGLLGGGPVPPVATILDELANRYPIDPKRVYLIGHGHGAEHAIELAQQDPGRYAAVAVLGGGRVTKPETLKGVPFFVGVGKLDSRLTEVQKLRTALEAAKSTVTYKEYDDAENLLVVREAARDVFKFFDETTKK